MSDAKKLKIALTGKPNSGKSSLFNSRVLTRRLETFPVLQLIKEPDKLHLMEIQSQRFLIFLVFIAYTHVRLTKKL